MKFEFQERRKNALMKREEITVSISHSGKGTPNRPAVMDEVAKMLKTKTENIIVTKISTPGGSTVSKANVFSYSSKEDIPAWRIKKIGGRISRLNAKREERPKEGETREGPAEEKAPEKKPPEGDRPAEEPKTEEKPPEGGSREGPLEEKPADETGPGEDKKE
jgi:ribosomal protein S24E